MSRVEQVKEKKKVNDSMLSELRISASGRRQEQVLAQSADAQTENIQPLSDRWALEHAQILASRNSRIKE